MKTIKQLSIFLENQNGKLSDIFNALKEESIEIQAASVADTTDYGILRLITSNQIQASKLLQSKGILVNVNEVLAIEIDANTSTFANAVETITKEGVSINYLYTFHKDGNLVLIIRPANLEHAESVISAKGLKLIQGWE
ncbi:MAG: acetolactate synthase [Bacteroidaceae bacterium]|nr:acetolactate synthase [Bacteroidaceae bacterium]MBO7260248.1 acetolactate synthase [Bacteroidaceae bacterium]